MTPAFPKRGPDAGTMDQVRPHCATWHQTTPTVDWPTYPLQTPSGGGLAPTPDRSKTPAKGFLASGEEGLTNQGPLQKGAMSVSALRRTGSARGFGIVSPGANRMGAGAQDYP